MFTDPRIAQAADATKNEVNPEETASLFSFLTWSYLGPIIRTANRVPYMSVDMLPPIMQGDRAKVLRNRNFKVSNQNVRKQGLNCLLTNVLIVVRPRYDGIQTEAHLAWCAPYRWFVFIF